MGEVDVKAVPLEASPSWQTEKEVVAWGVHFWLCAFCCLRRRHLSRLILSAERANMRSHSLDVLLRQFVPPGWHDHALLPLLVSRQNLFVGETRLYFGVSKVWRLKCSHALTIRAMAHHAIALEYGRTVGLIRRQGGDQVGLAHRPGNLGARFSLPDRAG